MVEPLGHVAIGLLFAFPAWLIWDGRVAGAFVGLTVLTSRLPDVDLVLQEYGFPVAHHGITHTLVFVLVFSVVVGIALSALFRPVLRRWWRMDEGEDVGWQPLFVFVTGALALGGVSHLIADGLAADWAEPIEPFWPFLEWSVEVGVVSYDSVVANLGLLVVAVVVHLALVLSELLPLETRFRHWRVELSDVDPSE